MIGTFVNVAAILAGTLLGLVLKKGIKESLNDAIIKAEGIAVLIIGANGVIGATFTLGENGKLTDNGGILLLISLVIGAFLGEVLKIDERMNKLGNFAEKHMKAEGFSRGFVTASLIFCVGTMAIVGSLEDGINNNHTLLFIKSILDGVTSLVLASTMGVGVGAAAVPVLIFQGGITLSAAAIAPYISGGLINDIAMVGNAVVMSIGINFIFGEKVKTANLLPSLLIPIIYHLCILPLQI